VGALCSPGGGEGDVVGGGHGAEQPHEADEVLPPSARRSERSRVVRSGSPGAASGALALAAYAGCSTDNERQRARGAWPFGRLARRRRCVGQGSRRARAFWFEFALARHPPCTLWSSRRGAGRASPVRRATPRGVAGWRHSLAPTASWCNCGGREVQSALGCVAALKIWCMVAGASPVVGVESGCAGSNGAQGLLRDRHREG
jgi:hypothetical protein